MANTNEIKNPERIARTTPVWLVNDRGEYTLHDFVGRCVAEFEPVDGDDSQDGMECVELLFRCRSTGLSRRFGLENGSRHPAVIGHAGTANGGI